MSNSNISWIFFVKSLCDKMADANTSIFSSSVLTELNTDIL